MFDGIKILDLSVSATALLQHERLTFPLPIDESTGAVLNHVRRSTDNGLTFCLLPTHADPNQYRVELSGSIHRYGRDGIHNADDFTLPDLLAALNQLVTTYPINPFTSRLNNVEFGVNVVLPFPVARVLKNLVSYKNRPFVKDVCSETPYYQCQTQRYVVKLYDKGHQYRNLDPKPDANLLRVEVKVIKMEYLTRQSIHLNSLDDLLTVSNYGALGALLVQTFTEILFNDPTINLATLTPKDREVCLNGRNPLFWSIPDDLTGREYERHRKGLQRLEKRYKMLQYRHSNGADWQSQTAALIGQTWERLIRSDNDLLTKINQHRAAWRTLQNEPENCPKLTGEPEPNNSEITVRNEEKNCPKLINPQTGEMSQINTLYLGVNRDITSTCITTTPGVGFCITTGVKIDQPKPGQRFVSASMLRHDEGLLMELAECHRQYRKGSKEDPPTRTAHNKRNAYHNPRNNLRRRIERLTRPTAQLTLFKPEEMFRLTPYEQTLLARF